MLRTAMTGSEVEGCSSCSVFAIFKLSQSHQVFTLREDQPPLLGLPPLPPGEEFEPGPELPPLPAMMFSFTERPLRTSYDTPSVNPRTTGTAMKLVPPWRDSITKAGSGLIVAIVAFWLSRLLRAWRAWAVAVLASCELTN